MSGAGVGGEAEGCSGRGSAVFTFTQIGFQRVSDENRADFCESRFITSFLRDPLNRGDRLGWLFALPGREATATC